MGTRRILLVVVEKQLLLVFCCLFALSSTGLCQSKPVFHWSFDDTKDLNYGYGKPMPGETTEEVITGSDFRISGLARYVPGVSGTAMKFDGFTTYVEGMPFESSSAAVSLAGKSFKTEDHTWEFKEGNNLRITGGLAGAGANGVYEQEGTGIYIQAMGQEIFALYDGEEFEILEEEPEHMGFQMPREISIEAWISMGAYPWNWVPILTIGKYKVTGFYFGVDSRGRLGFYLSDATSVWHECISDVDPKSQLGMDIQKWYHVVGTYSPGKGMAIYINGTQAGTYDDFTFDYGIAYSAMEEGFRIGRNRVDLAPSEPIRDWATYPSQYAFDGIIDELKVHGKALSAKEVKAIYKSVKPENEPQFESRHFPTVKPSGRFGANYTRLKFYPEWDALWPVGDYMDVVVQFDEYPTKVMFWRGTRYSACLVSENGKWMADQSRETGGNWFLGEGPREDFVTGCVEHMSDTQCRSSRVAIIENNDARAVVNWRYLQMDVKFRQNDVPLGTSFGEWGNELYYIYPDAVSVRKVLPGYGGWQETIFLNEPGTRPEDNVELEACTLVNMDGESRTYTWEHGYPVFDLDGAVIQMTNFKSEFKPYMIFREGGGFEVFNLEVRPQYSHFPWWNHWPVAQTYSDGRSANAPDRAAHSSLSWGDPGGDAAIYGMTNKPAVSLVDLARSWNYPPEMKVGGGAISEGYDYSQRAYVLNAEDGAGELQMEFAANEKSPLFNLVLVVNNWSESDVLLKSREPTKVALSPVAWDE
jgi:hypothetical protein